MSSDPPNAPVNPGSQPPLRLLGRAFALAAALGLALWGGRDLWEYGRRESIGFDYYQFWVVTQSVSENLVQNIYDDGDREVMGKTFAERAAQRPPRSRWAQIAQVRTFIKTWSTPFLYTAFRPLASGSYNPDLRNYQALSLTCAVAGILAFAGLAGLGPVGSLLALAFVLLYWFPLRADVAVTNVNPLQLAWLAAAVALAGRRAGAAMFAGGALFGVLVTFKPNLAAALLVLAAVEVSRRRWKRLAVGVAGFGVGALAAAAASVAFFGGLQPWADWIEFLSGALFSQRAMTMAEHGNYGLDRLVFEASGVHIGSYLLVALLGTLAVTLWREWHQEANVPGPADERYDTLRAIAAGLILGLVSAPLTFTHYYLQALPALLLLLARPPGSRAIQIGVRAFCLGLFFAFGAPESFWSALGVPTTEPAVFVGIISGGTLALWFALLSGTSCGGAGGQVEPAREPERSLHA